MKRDSQLIKLIKGMGKHVYQLNHVYLLRKVKVYQLNHSNQL
jgi:hypothetical protein